MPFREVLSYSYLLSPVTCSHIQGLKNYFALALVIFIVIVFIIAIQPAQRTLSTLLYYLSNNYSNMTDASSETPPTFGEIMDKAAKSALRGGTAGAVAMGLNVGALMWMRTTVRY